MGDWPRLPDPYKGNPVSFHSYGPHMLCSLGLSPGGPSAATWPVASKALAMPLRLARSTIIRRFGVFNGAVSGNIDIGIYDRNWVRLGSLGGVAHVNANTIQIATLGTPLFLPPGLYYLAVVFDNTTAAIQRYAPATVLPLQASGMAEMGAAYPLPATFVPVSLSSPYMPSVCAWERSSP